MQWDCSAASSTTSATSACAGGWRADLAARGERVRLWVDDAAALRWMAPRRRAPASTVRAWPDERRRPSTPGDVVVEAFGCDLPRASSRAWRTRRAAAGLDQPGIPERRGLRRAQPRPAVAAVQRPRRGPDASGSSTRASRRRTGGLLREPDLLARAARPSTATPGWPRTASRRGRRAARQPVLLRQRRRCRALLDRSGGRSRRCCSPRRAGRGAAARPARPAPRAARCASHALPWLPQPDYDHLLWACDLNFVRGEDSFVRAQWAGRPFVWQIYPQHDGAHAAKLDAFLDRCLAGARRRAARAACAPVDGLERRSAPMPGRCRDLAALAAHVRSAGATQLLAQRRPGDAAARLRRANRR